MSTGDRGARTDEHKKGGTPFGSPQKTHGKTTIYLRLDPLGTADEAL